jgi:hypothetical protein
MMTLQTAKKNGMKGKAPFVVGRLGVIKETHEKSSTTTQSACPLSLPTTQSACPLSLPTTQSACPLSLPTSDTMVTWFTPVQSITGVFTTSSKQDVKHVFFLKGVIFDVVVVFNGDRLEVEGETDEEGRQ